MPDRLAPVSFNPLNRSFTSISTDDLGLFTAFPASLNSYMKYTFYAKLPYTIQDSTVIQMAADFDSMASFAYAAVDVGSDIYLLHGVGSRSYVPVISSNDVIGVDANSNDIVDSSETALSNLGPTVTASTSPMTIPLTFTENGEIKTITVYMWAEGQDPACRGPIPAFTAGISISIDAPTVANHLGDINGDGNVSSTDALMALQASSGLLILNEEQLVSADVNDSKGVTSVDALIILQYSAGLITTF